MIVLVWVGWIVVALLTLFVALLLAGLLSRVSVEGRVGPDGVAARGRWGLIGVRMQGGSDAVEVRLLGVRLPRVGSMRAGEGRDASDADADADADAGRDDGTADETSTKPTTKKQKRKGRRRPSWLGYRRLVRTALRELRRMARHVHVERLRIDAVVATDDPATTGETYGLAIALAAWMRHTWPRVDVSLEPDFIATRPRVTAEGALHLRPVRFVPGTARVAWSYWTERRRSRPRA